MYSYYGRLLRMIASRVRTELDPSARAVPSESSRTNVNLKTVAVLPSSRNVPIEAFSRKLFAALESVGAPTSYLNQSSVSDHLGRHAFTRIGKLKAAGWLAEQEQKYRIVLYVADSAVSSTWTQTCIRQVCSIRLRLRGVVWLMYHVNLRPTMSWSSEWEKTLRWENTSDYYYR